MAADQPLRCPNCGNEDGDFDLKTGLCETCTGGEA
jgi:hypothetical protein